MSNFLILIIAFIVAISVLVAVHEFGHFWVARRLGIKVLRFSIGFGKPIWSRVAGPDQTEYVISALPLGGYVKMLDEREGPIAEADRGRAFNQAPVWARLAVLAAGPAFNFLFAIVAYWALFMLGVSELRPVIGEIEADSHAGRAGLVAGQEIVSVDHAPVENWQEANLAIVDDLVDDGIIKLTVLDEQGEPREVTIDAVADKRRLTEPGELLNGLGIYIVPRNTPPIIGEVSDGDAAAAAGIQVGDRIVAFSDT
ncbi:MAG: RIP metalloprotease RseP, partial [Gammaproteobacteria bacterium]|nr:RIP metalloprotease RseP [Gammaproteobacteria bacterium]